MEDLYVSMAVSVLLSTIKNPDKKAKLKTVFLKVYQTIKTVYAGDPDFA
jgi:hypothetical protein